MQGNGRGAPMADDRANPAAPARPPGRASPGRQSIERHGLGQSGYTAGRRDRDLALERQLVSENPTHPRQFDERELQDALGTDERFRR